MAAYVIFIRERLRDQAAIDVYSPQAGRSLDGHSVKILAAYGAHEGLEGSPSEGVVLLEFPTMSDARTWYDGPAYREAREHRFQGADYRAIIFEGL